MTDLAFLPTLPLTMSYPLLFGVLLVAGMLGGEAARQLRLPRVIGYVLVGFAIAPAAAAMNIGPLLDEARIFVDIGLGLVLFDLGRRMDLAWLKRDWTLAASGLAESFLTFGLVFAALAALGFAPLMAGLAAAIAMATSPAVVLLVVQDARADGQVTDRALTLVALNSLLASVVVTMLTAPVHFELHLDLDTAVLHPLYLFVGSLALGGAMAWVARMLAHRVERNPELHFTLVAGLVLGAVGLAQMGRLSVILALLALGMFVRNDRDRHILVNVDLGRASRLFYVVLFVITGASLPIASFETAGWAALAFVVARAAGKFLGVVAIAPLGGMKWRQAIALGAALLPMSSIALLLIHDVSRIYPELGQRLAAVVVAGVIVMELLGPIATQWGLRFAGEAAPLPAAGPAARVSAAKGADGKSARTSKS
ncbi:MAG TPA: cation:proton antiporter [Usitatibacteraceae bacterium]|nr:cation:proton antiporter [Usitatibacteraceae bacterium]